jgi:hypothetical protein
MQSISNPILCVDTLGISGQPVALYPCNGNMTHPSRNQKFVLSYSRDVRKGEEECLDLPDSKPFSPILLVHCHELQGNQLWRYDPVNEKKLK